MQPKLGKTRAELAAYAPIGPGAGKAAAGAGAAAAATLAMGSSAAAAPIVGAQHAAPAAHAFAATRPRTEETATETGAAVAGDQAMPGSGATSSGEAVSCRAKPANWTSMTKGQRQHWYKRQHGEKDT